MTLTEDPPVVVAKPPEQVKRELQPILAAWLKDSDAFIETVRDTGHRVGHTTVWHAVHSPLHYARLLRYAPRGAGRVVKSISGWVFHAEAAALRREAVNANNAAEWRAQEKERKERVALRWRLLVLMMILALICIGLWWWLVPHFEIAFGWVLTPWWTFVLLATASVIPLGYIGRPIDKPLLKRATDASGNPPLKPEIILEALCSLGIAKMNKPEEIRVFTDMAREGKGYRVEFELPGGVTAESVVDKRAELAGAIRRELGCVWPWQGPRHPSHLVVFVSDEPMAKAKQKPWPLLKQGLVDVFKPAPLFTDQQGNWIQLVLAYTCGVIGAVPRMGKTFVLRSILLLGGLDPRCKIYSYDLKGTGDLSPLKLVAHRYGVGDEDEDIAQQLDEMRELNKELRRRVKVIRKIAEEKPAMCPDTKVTSELASLRALNLEPILLGVDECQRWFEHKDAAIRGELIEICTDLVKRGPAAGIMSYFATQKPDAKAIPTGIADNAIIRFCLKVFGYRSNDQVLGTGAYKSGINATMFAFEDKGIGYFRGEGADAQIARSIFGLDAIAAGKVALRARAAREQEGRLTGYAAGDEMDREVQEVILLDDVRQVFGVAEAMHLGDIVTGLAELRPGAWGALDAASLGSQLRTAGVKTDTVYVAGKPRTKAAGKGVKRVWLDVDTTVEVGNSDPEIATESQKVLTRE